MTAGDGGRERLEVKGEIRTLAFREGSSGVFTGSIEGLYQGYRFASSEPVEEQHELPTTNGTLAVTVRQGIQTPLTPRPAVHPFAGDADPFANQPRAAKLRMLGRLLRHAWLARSPQFNPFKRVHYMRIEVIADPERSTGIFAGATGTAEIEAPQYRMAGYVVIDTTDGELRIDFLEKGDRRTLAADMRVDGARSTGRWKDAEGTLEFKLDIRPPNLGRGPYWGTIWLAGTGESP